jgi:hypothetical protein
MKTFRRNLSVNAFARFFELVIVPDVIKSTMGNFTKLSMHAALSTPDDRTPEKGLREFRSLPAARPT